MPAGLASHADKSAKFFFGTSTALLALVLVIAIIASFQGEDTPVPMPSPTAPSDNTGGGKNDTNVPPSSEVETPPNWPEIPRFMSGDSSAGENAVFHMTLAQMARIAYCQNSEYCPEHAGATVEGWHRGRLETTPPSGLQAITFVDDYDTPARCVIAFRGTSLNTSRGDGLADLCANLYMREGALYRDLPDACRTHFPEFILNYRARAVDFVKTVLYGFKGVGVVVTGHSLGGTLAMHAALHIKDVPVAAVAFSTAPHVGLESDNLSNNRFIRVIADRYDPVMQSSQRPWMNASVCTYRAQNMPISCFACYKENHTSFDMNPDSSIGFDWMLSGACGACFYETHYFSHVLDLVYDYDATQECNYYPGQVQPIQMAVWEDVKLFEARSFPKAPDAPITVPINALSRQVPPGWEDTQLSNVNGLSTDELQNFIGDFLNMAMIANCHNAPDAMCQIEHGVDAKVDGWVRGSEEHLPEYGMHAITFFDNAENPKKIVIAYRGTDFTIDRIDARADLCATDLMLSGEWTTSVQILANCTGMNRTALQYMDRAEEFARHVQMKYPEAGIVFTGHSIGGMLALHSALHVTEWNTAAVAFSPSTSTRHGFDTFWGKRRFAWVFADINDPMMLLTNEKDWVGDICLYDVDTHLNCEVCKEDFLKASNTVRHSVTAFLGSQSCNLCLEEAHPISHLRELLSMGRAPDCWHYGNAE